MTKRRGYSLRAIAAYQTLNADTLELVKARRYIEVRWGALLGPAQPGPPTESFPAGKDSTLNATERHEFRALAAEPAVITTILAATDTDDAPRRAVRAPKRFIRSRLLAGRSF